MSGWRALGRRGGLSGLSLSGRDHPVRRLCHCSSLSLRDVELILAARGIVVSYESIRDWGLRFGRTFANTLKRRRPRQGDKRFLDEVFIRIRRAATSTTALKCRISRHDDESGKCNISNLRSRRSAFYRIHSHFQLRRHRIAANEYRAARDAAFCAWHDVTGTVAAA